MTTLNCLAALIAQGAKFVSGVNPRAIQFLCHYLGGSKKPMKLNRKEIECTKSQVIDAIKNGNINDDGTGWVMCPSGDWLTHTTKGVVGGFVFNWVTTDKGFLIKCVDEWDFNNGTMAQGTSCVLDIPNSVPEPLLKMGLKALESLHVKVYDVWDDGTYSIAESSLAQFNERGRFLTEWEVLITEPVYCPLNN